MRLSGIFLISAAFAQHPDTTGWSEARWGMTAQQVRAAFPTARPIDPPERDGALLVRLEAPGVNLGIFQARAQFAFLPDQDHLTAVTVSITQDTNRPSAFDAIKDGLTDKYGRPTTSDSVTDHTTFGSAITTRTITWRLRSSMISLIWIESRDVGMVLVRYAERKPDPSL